MNEPLKEIMTAAEAAKLWGLSEGTVRNSCFYKRFNEDECRKSGNTWLVTLSGMKRLYGEKKKKAPED